ncbi:hypothetical protein Lal_00014104 [Lupinus albus]|nr:hypothetical protein Lal_00014104 [Lupinus albus]
MSHTMRLTMFNHFSSLKLLVVPETCFASIIDILKMFKFFKRSLQSMVISEEWDSYREGDIEHTTKAQGVKEHILNDIMLRACDTDSPTLHLVYEMWDTMIEKVRSSIFRHEGKDINSTIVMSGFKMLQICMPLTGMRRFLWREISVSLEYANFSLKSSSFDSFDSIEDMWRLDPKSWWVLHGSSTPLLQKLALKLLVQPCSSSCCERNWNTYLFIHSAKRNKLKPKRAEDLVCVHINLRLLYRKSEEYKQRDTKMWDIAGDAWKTLIVLELFNKVMIRVVFNFSENG